MKTTKDPTLYCNKKQCELMMNKNVIWLMVIHNDIYGGFHYITVLVCYQYMVKCEQIVGLYHTVCWLILIVYLMIVWNNKQMGV